MANNNNSTKTNASLAAEEQAEINKVKAAHSSVQEEATPMVALVMEAVVVEPLRQRVRSETRPCCRARRGTRRTMQVPRSSTCSRCSSKQSRLPPSISTQKRTMQTTTLSITDSPAWRRTEARQPTPISSTMPRRGLRANQGQQASTAITTASNTTTSTTDSSSSRSNMEAASSHSQDNMT